MQDNQHYIQQKKNEHYNMQMQDKDVFNRQALEDKLHAEKTSEEKKKWSEWQKESLKNDYDEQINRKRVLHKLEKDKDKIYADQYKNSIEAYEHNHNKALDDRRQRNNTLLDQQQRTVIPDLNDKRKADAMNTMKRQFENTEKQTLMNELERLNKKNNEAKETKSMLRMQMDVKRKVYDTTKQEDKNYKDYIDNTVSMLGERDRKMKEEKAKMRLTYAQELENQIKEHQDKEKRFYNEMDERNLTLNQKGLIAYEAGERNAGLFKLPGIDREPTDNREYFGRYTKKKEPSRLSAQMALSHTGGLNSERMMRDIPQTSKDYTSVRRSSRGGLLSPPNNNSNILGQPKVNAANSGMSKYKSMANIHTQEYTARPIKSPEKKESNEIETYARRSTTMLSPKNMENVEYEPTKKDEMARRPKPVGETTEPKEVVKSLGSVTKITKQPLPSTSPKISKAKKAKQAPASLLDIDSKLNQRILGSMRTGTLNISNDNYSYGRTGTNTYRGYTSSHN